MKRFDSKEVWAIRTFFLAKEAMKGVIRFSYQNGGQPKKELHKGEFFKKDMLPPTNPQVFLHFQKKESKVLFRKSQGCF